MAAEFEQNLAAFEVIAANNGFLAPITPIEELPDYADYMPISDRAGLEAISSNLDGKYYLTADIDLAGDEWVPIGSLINKFRGALDGQGHTISNLMITGSTHTANGLFGYVGESNVKNLGMKSSNIDVTSNYSGGVVGSLSSSSAMTIKNCFNTGFISGTEGAGGILGYAPDSSTTLVISDCYNTGDITVYNSAYSSGTAGGIVGSASVSMSNCYNTGNVTGTMLAGGIGASLRNATIEYCYNAGDVTATQSNAGGIVALLSDATIEYCYNSGVVSAVSSAGGIVSFMPLADAVAIRNSYNAGDVTGTSAGGMGASLNNATIENCYNTGDMISTQYFAGGIGGSLTNATIENCCNTGVVSAVSSAGGIAGAYTSSTDVTIINCYNAGDVTGTSTGGIFGRVNLQNSFMLISNSYNTGSISGTSSSGGISGGGSVPSDSSMIVSKCFNSGDVTIRPGANAGGIFGAITALSQFSIDNCYNIGDISCATKSTTPSQCIVGGIIGRLLGSSTSSVVTINKSYNAGDVSILAPTTKSESFYAGGIIGDTTLTRGDAMITNCASVGSIITTTAGTANRAIIANGINNNPSNNNIACTVSNGNFADVVSASYPKYEFLKQSTYTAIGWDFDEVWKMSGGATPLPVLQWQGDVEFDIEHMKTALGDTTGDGEINILDVDRLFRSVTGQTPSSVFEIEDINGDGEVNILDVDKLFRYVTGQIPSL
jgi:hypothetical protein